MTRLLTLGSLLLAGAAWAGPPAGAVPEAGGGEESDPAGDSGAPPEAPAAPVEPSPERPDKGIGRGQLAASASLAQATQGENGLAIQTMCTNCNEADLDLGGFGDQHINVELDGYRLCGGLPRIYAFSIFPSSAVSKLEITPGPGLAEHASEAIGGTVSVTTREPTERPLLQATAETGSFGWNKQVLLVAGKLGRVSGRAAGTRSHFDAIDADGDGSHETGTTDQWTARVDLTLDTGPAGKLTVGGVRIHDEQIGGKGHVEKTTATGEPVGYLVEDTIVDWEEFHVGHDVTLPGGHVLRIRTARFDREQAIDAPPVTRFEPKQSRYRILEENRHAELKWRGPLGERVMLSAGFSAEEDLTTVSGGAMPFHLTELEESVETWGAFSQARIGVRPRLSLTLGARRDHVDIRSDPPPAFIPPWAPPVLPRIVADEWSPRASVTWKPLDELRIQALYGRGIRPPRPVFNEICCGQSPERNVSVRPERSRSTGLDVTYQPTPAVRFNVYAHESRFTDYIVKMAAGSVDLKQKLVQGNIPAATIRGVSVYASWRGDGGLNLSASFTALDARNEGDTITLLPNVWDPVDVLWPVTLPLDEIPYLVHSRGQFAWRYAPRGGRYSVNALAQFTGPMKIQHYDDVRYGFGVLPPGGLREDYVETPETWLVNLSAKFAVLRHVELLLGVDNLFDTVQDDLGDYSTDYNWGPIRGRYAYAGVTYTF